MNELLRNGTKSASIAIIEDLANPDADVADVIVDGGVATVKGAATGMAIKAAGTALASTAVTTGVTVAAAPVVVIGGLIGGIFGLFD